LPKWWNWQTHHLEGVAGRLVRVQIPPSALLFSSIVRFQYLPPDAIQINPVVFIYDFMQFFVFISKLLCYNLYMLKKGTIGLLGRTLDYDYFHPSFLIHGL
jgi:hypothetical protein